MQVKRFVAADMRRALELVRQDMGPDAIILSSGRTEGGVEVLTSYDSPFHSAESETVGKKTKREISAAMSSLNKQLRSTFKKTRSEDVQSKPLHSDSAWSGPDVIEVDLANFSSSKKAKTKQERLNQTTAENITPNDPISSSELEQSPEAENLKNISQQQEFHLASFNYEPGNVNVSLSFDPVLFTQNKEQGISQDESAQATIATTLGTEILDDANSQASKMQQDTQFNALRDEILDMRELLQIQLSQLSGTDNGSKTSNNSGAITKNLSVVNTVHTTIGKRLEKMGIPQRDITRCLSRLKLRATLNDAWAQVLATLAHRLPTTENDVVDKGGFFAFVGSAGAGKTTTVAKLAARYVLKHGAEGVALISTDNQSLAGVEQLRRVGKILGIEVHHVNESNSLAQVMLDCCDYKLVLVDTAGLRQGDPELKHQLANLRAFSHLKNYLVMACNTQTQWLKASVHAYKNVGLAGCVLTKLDETISLGETLGVVMQENISVSYYTDGRDFTRHIGVARPHKLITLAVSLFKKANQRESEAAQEQSAQVRSTESTQRFAYN